MSDATKRSDKIATLWIEGAMREVDQVCIRSMVRAGLDVTVYRYGEVDNIPDGVKIADGREVLDLSLMDRLKMVKRQDRLWQVPANFSDFFRIFMQKYELGLWLDSDVYVFRHFDYATDRPYFFKEDGTRIGSPVFYLPSDSPIIGEYERLMEQDELMPNWLGPWRGIVRPTWWRLTGQAFSPPDLGITIYGNDAFTRLARRHGVYGEAGSKKAFYHWGARENEKLFNATDFRFFLDDPEYLGIHIHRKHLALQPPVPGSFWEWAREQ